MRRPWPTGGCPPPPKKIPISRMEGDTGKCGGGGSLTPVRSGGDGPVGPSCRRFCTRTDVSLGEVICTYLVKVLALLGRYAA